MARVLHISGVVVLALACAVFGLSLRLWTGLGPEIQRIQDSPTAVEMFRETNDQRADRLSQSAPVVLQAEALASYLNPPKGAGKPTDFSVRASRPLSASFVRPSAPSVKFRLLGTSYYPNQPARSMALISEPGRPDDTRKWVKEGAQLSHFVVHEIRRGAIVLHDGDDLREMTVEHGSTRPSLVRDVWSGSRKVSTATSHGAAMPAGPNSVEADGGD